MKPNEVPADPTRVALDRILARLRDTPEEIHELRRNPTEILRAEGLSVDDAPPERLEMLPPLCEPETCWLLTVCHYTTCDGWSCFPLSVCTVVPYTQI